MRILLQSPVHEELFTQVYFGNFVPRLFYEHEILIMGPQRRCDIYFDPTCETMQDILEKLPWMPDFYLCQCPEWQILPRGIENSPFPLVAFTFDYDYFPHRMKNLACIFDAFIVPGGIAHTHLKQLGANLVFTFPGWTGYLDRITPLDYDGEKPIDVFFSGHMSKSILPERLRILFKVASLPLNVIISSYLGDEYKNYLSKSKVIFTFHRRGEFQSRTIEAQASGCYPIVQLAPEVEVGGVRFRPNETEIYLEGGYKYYKDEKNVDIKVLEALKNWNEVERKERKKEIIEKYEVKERLRRFLNFLQFCMPKVREEHKKRTERLKRFNPAFLNIPLMPTCDPEDFEKIVVWTLKDALEHVKGSGHDETNLKGVIRYIFGEILQVQCKYSESNSTLQEAVYTFLDGVRRYPESFILRYNLGVCAFHTKIPQAKDILLETLNFVDNVDFNDIYIFSDNTREYSYQKEYSELFFRGDISGLRKLFRSNVYYFLGRISEENGDIEKALEFFKGAAKFERRAIFLFELACLDSSYAQEALSLAPLNSERVVDVVRSKVELGDIEGARDIARNYFEILRKFNIKNNPMVNYEFEYKKIFPNVIKKPEGEWDGRISFILVSDKPPDVLARIRKHLQKHLKGPVFFNMIPLIDGEYYVFTSSYVRRLLVDTLRYLKPDVVITKSRGRYIPFAFEGSILRKLLRREKVKSNVISIDEPLTTFEPKLYSWLLSIGTFMD